MAKKNDVRPVSYPEEFTNWLKTQKIKKRERRNPEVVERYYEEWSRQHGRKRRAKFKLPALDLDQIAHQARRVSELVETIQGVRNLMNQPKHPED